MKSLIVGVGLIAVMSGQVKRDGWYVWTLPATIEALRDVPVRTEQRGAQKRGVIYIFGPEATPVPTKLRKGTRFQMTRIDSEGECAIRLHNRTFNVSSCPWPSGFADHEEDVFKVIRGRRIRR